MAPGVAPSTRYGTVLSMNSPVEQAVPPCSDCFRPLPREIDRRWPLSGGNGRFRPSPTDFERYQRGREKEEEGEEENLKISSPDLSPAGDFFSPRGEKKRDRTLTGCRASPHAGTRRRLVFPRGIKATSLTTRLPARGRGATSSSSGRTRRCSPTGKAHTARYIPVQQLTGMWTGRYRAVPLKSIVDSRFRPSAPSPPAGDFSPRAGRWNISRTGREIEARRHAFYLIFPSPRAGREIEARRPCLNIIRAFGRIRSLGESRPNPFFGRRRRRHPLLPTFLGRLRILIETNIVSRSWDIGIANNVQGLLLRHQARESSVRDTHGEVRRRRRRRRRLRVILHGEFRLDDSHSPDGIQQEKGRGGSGPTAASERDARGRGGDLSFVSSFLTHAMV
ncbi:hypothetical protein BHE74_00025328 [Ensete ventricosum]|nr:hypothetical protein BHE74_00025328 [Ensete ventricosum]